MNEENCIFCKIVAGEIPCYKVYEDENFLAFLDIKPVALGHTLVIPKKHIVWMHEAEDTDISLMFIFVKKIMLAMKKSLPCDFVQVSVVGKDVPHFHIHLIPRFMNDSIGPLPSTTYENKNEKEFAEKIKRSLV